MKDRYINLLKSVKREGMDKLIASIEKSDFFTAPASTIYHGNYEGGLVEHSLNVYDCLNDIVNKFYPGKYSQDSIILVALLHDLSKKDYYEKTVRNRKWYKPDGTKHDEMGNFEWVAVSSYGIKEPEARYAAGGHCFNSLMLIRNYIELTDEETIAIFNHSGIVDMSDTQKRESDQIFNRFPLATALHLADMEAAYFLENKVNESTYKRTTA